MLAQIIASSVRHRIAVLLAAAMLTLLGAYSVYHTPTDAIPDLSDVQVIVYADYPDQAPQIVEAQVTFPLTTALRAVPGARTVRGFSHFGGAFVHVIFADGTDLYWARARVLEYLNTAARKLPKGVTPALGPDATGVGWVYQYALVDRSGGHDLAQLRSLQDWFFRYELQSVPGVAEVASVGGFVKQYQVELEPAQLAAYGVSVRQVREAIERSNNDVGGRSIETSETELMVRGLGYIQSTSDIEKIAVMTGARGVPVRIKDLGRVVIGPESRRGIAELNGEGEVVGGIVVMRSGENARAVIAAVKKRIVELRQGLPPGVEVLTVYDRSQLIERAIDTLQTKLWEEMLVVALVCFLFLAHLRSALVAVITLPLGILCAFIIMRYQGINASIMSLGGIAIAIGAMVDASVVMVENAHKRLENAPADAKRTQIILEAAQQVGPALFFSLLIITVSFLPVFALEAQEGRLFHPLAYTKTYAMAAAAILSITLAPVLMVYMLRGKIRPEADNPINRFFMRAYTPVLSGALRHKLFVLVAALVAIALTLWPYQRLGSEFMPTLDEGDLLYMPTTLPEISAGKTRELLQQTDRIIKQHPEVKNVFGKAGRADTATDPAPMMMLETTIQLKDRALWRPGMTREKIIEELDRSIKIPGLSNTWTMPIKGRIEMLSTGIKALIGIKIAGPDMAVLEETAKRVEAVLQRVPGASNVFAERNLSAKYLNFKIDRDAAALNGLLIADIQDVMVSAIGGEEVTTIIEAGARYSVNIRYPRDLRDSPESIARILVPRPGGGSVPLAQLGTLEIASGPSIIRTENARLNAWVYADVEGRDVGSFLKDAQAAVAKEITLPPNYSVLWSGEHEHIERVSQRLWVVIPLTLAAIFLLLYLNFRDFSRTLMVMLSLPFALIGGVWFLYFMGYALSVASAVGFVALAGVAAETGVVMLLYLDIASKDLMAKIGRVPSAAEIVSATMRGAVSRLRPKLMTVTAIIAGLLPIMWGHGAGSEIMRRIAAPMIGGMISSTLLTLIVIPVIFAWHWERQATRDVHGASMK